jgi:hypothetical protein
VRVCVYVLSVPDSTCAFCKKNRRLCHDVFCRNLFLVVLAASAWPNGHRPNSIYSYRWWSSRPADSPQPSNSRMTLPLEPLFFSFAATPGRQATQRLVVQYPTTKRSPSMHFLVLKTNERASPQVLSSVWPNLGWGAVIENLGWEILGFGQDDLHQTHGADKLSVVLSFCYSQKGFLEKALVCW